VDTLAQRLVPPVVAAHRGGDFEPGSPLAKVEATLLAGNARVLEIDLRLTSDGVVVVSHDDAIHGSGRCKGPIENFTYAALAECESSTGGKSISLFADVLDLVHGRAIINAEFKTMQVIAPAIDLVEIKHAKSWIYFQATGDLGKYRLARKIDPDVALLLKVTSDAEIRRAIGLHDPHLVILEMDRDFITPQRVARIHAAGMLVSENSFRYQFTDERFVASCDHVFSLGADIAVTNNPASCVTQRGSWRSGRSNRYSSLCDRQHLRADFAGNKHALELFAAGLGALLFALPLQGWRLILRRARRKRDPA
jgi:glycerophosphoryl diester phosphodiesterase